LLLIFHLSLSFLINVSNIVFAFIFLFMMISVRITKERNLKGVYIYEYFKC